MQFPHHYGEVRGLSNVLILQRLIKTQRVKEIEKIPNEYQKSLYFLSQFVTNL